MDSTYALQSRFLNFRPRQRGLPGGQGDQERVAGENREDSGGGSVELESSVEHHLTLRQVSVEGGELVVRFTTAEELRLASKELLLLKRELRSQRRVALAKAKEESQYLRLPTPAKHKSYLALMKEVAHAPVGAFDAQIRAVEAAENQVAAAILARQVR